MTEIPRAAFDTNVVIDMVIAKTLQAWTLEKLYFDLIQSGHIISLTSDRMTYEQAYKFRQEQLNFDSSDYFIIDEHRKLLAQFWEKSASVGYTEGVRSDIPNTQLRYEDLHLAKLVLRTKSCLVTHDKEILAEAEKLQKNGSKVLTVVQFARHLATFPHVPQIREALSQLPPNYKKGAVSARI